jgi:hypothetical protein
MRIEAGKPARYCPGHWPIQERCPIEEVVVDEKPALRIPLTQNKFTVIDPEDLIRIPGLWCITKGNGKEYATQNAVDVNGKHISIKMHRVILGCVGDVDHKNGDTLDNRKCNLREATDSQNLMNQQPQIGRSSKYKGVCFVKRTEKWESYIKVGGKKMHLGHFSQEDAAAKAYNVAAITYFGDFARLNVI